MSDHLKLFDKFSNNVLHMIITAKASSIKHDIDCLYPESFVLAILLSGKNIVTSSLVNYDVNLEHCVSKFTKILIQKKNSTESQVSYDEIKISQELLDILKYANKISVNNNHDFIGLGHIFAAIMEIKLEFRHIMAKECKGFKECLDLIVNNQVTQTNRKAPVRKTKMKDDTIFSQFCTDMTEQAANGEFHPILSRDNEIEEAITIICRKNKSNPILVGEAGVGKTALVEGIAQRIVSKKVPKKLQGCKIYSLNITGMVAGTKYRGDFEKRIQDLIKAVEEDPKCIIFIDEIHTIVGAGGAGNPMDAANILKPALARKMRCIGATTHHEYKKHFAEDGALSRRFGVVNVDEPSEADVKKILLGIKDKFEEYHECKIANEAIDTIIQLTKRYRPTEFFPDKAIDCMDTACAKLSWQHRTDVLPTITSDDIARIISKQCQVPLEVIMWNTREKIVNIETFLKEKIIGQDEAVKSVCRVLRNAYSGVRNPDRPLGVVAFGGQSGTGKTYTAKQMSRAIFGNEQSLIRVDMSEFSESHSISKIIGSPPGYVGFKDTDVIVDKIKRKPYSIVLLDEIEKAHPQVLRLFLQVMGDGVITSAIGEKINCKNLFFIMTGNFGMNTLKTPSIGFGESSKNIVDSEKERLLEFCKKAYGEEFVNRVDSFVPFMEINDEDFKQIAKLRLSEFAERLNNKNIKITIGAKMADSFAHHRTGHGMNAMMLERVIVNKIQPLVADAILELEDLDSYNYTLTLDSDDKHEFFVSKRKRKK